MTQGRIVIDSERCKGCELCTGVCPQHVLSMSGVFNSNGYLPAQLLDPTGACTGCGVCAVICPDTAITVFRQTVKEPRIKNGHPQGQPTIVEFGSRFSVLSSSVRRL